MRQLIGNPAFAKNAQIILIVAYALLAALFVKDTGVFALAFLMKRFS